MNKLVTLVSGGVDSTLMSIIADEQGFELFPLFIDYGQIAAEPEWNACVYNHKNHALPNPRKMNLKGFGRLIHSGLTNKQMRVREDAFLPGRNALFLTVAASYAYQVKSNNVAIGLLSDEFALFPDQQRSFVQNAEILIRESLKYDVAILTPLIEFNKADVLKLAKTKKITKTYSCHAGTVRPCGKCISCLDKKKGLAAIGGK